MADLVDALACLKLNSTFEHVKVRLGDMRDDEIIVRMKATGLCHGDIQTISGGIPVPVPLCAGHEGAGVVEKVGSAVHHVQTGDHVVLSFSFCGHCIQCKKNKPSYCKNYVEYNFQGSRLDGSTSLELQDGRKLSSHFFGQSSFSHRAIVRGHTAVKVDKDLPLDLLCTLGCGMQTGAGTVLNVLKPVAGASLLVFGVGSVGLAAVMGGKLTEAAKIIAVDIVDSKLEMARELGATHTINSLRQDAIAEIMLLTEGEGVECALDATGNLQVIQQMLDCIAPGGIAATVGSPGYGKSLQIEPAEWITRGVSYVGVCMGSAVPSQFIPELINQWRNGSFPIDKIVTTYPFQDIQAAQGDLHDGSCIKAVLLWPDV